MDEARKQELREKALQKILGKVARGELKWPMTVEQLEGVVLITIAEVLLDEGLNGQDQ